MEGKNFRMLFQNFKKKKDARNGGVRLETRREPSTTELIALSHPSYEGESLENLDHSGHRGVSRYEE